ERTGGIRKPGISSNFGSDGLNLNTEPAARAFAVLLQLLDHRPGSAGWYRKANPDGSTIGRIDGRVDADDITFEVEGRAAGIAPVHRCINLQKIVVRTGVDVTPAPGNDAAADSIVEAERTADREYPVSNPSPIAVAPTDIRQRARPIDLEQGDIGQRVTSDDPSRVLGRVL